MRRKNRFFVVAFSLIVIAVSFISFWLFRSDTIVHPYYGKMSLKFRWGQPYFLSVDLDEDGKNDFLAIWPGYEDNIPPIECWSDPGRKGFFEYHVLFDDGSSKKVEIDIDGDGKYDRVMTDEEVEKLATEGMLDWKALKKP